MYWYNPFGVTNVETRFAPSVSGTCQYPFSKSKTYLQTWLVLPCLCSHQSEVWDMSLF